MSRNDLSPWYVTGFIECAGSFTYSYARNRAAIAVVFAIRLAAADRAVLESIQTFFGDVGRLYSTGQGKSSVYLKITRPADLLRILDHFESYPLRGTKRRAFEIWRRMVVLKTAHLGQTLPRELQTLAEALSRLGPRDGQRSTSK